MCFVWLSQVVSGVGGWTNQRPVSRVGPSRSITVNVNAPLMHNSLSSIWSMCGLWMGGEGMVCRYWRQHRWPEWPLSAEAGAFTWLKCGFHCIFRTVSLRMSQCSGHHEDISLVSSLPDTWNQGYYLLLLLPSKVYLLYKSKTESLICPLKESFNI